MTNHPTSSFERFVRDGIEEAERAMIRFPQPNYVITNLSDVIDGKAVIVPVEPTKEMNNALEVAKKDNAE